MATTAMTTATSTITKSLQSIQEEDGNDYNYYNYKDDYEEPTALDNENVFDQHTILRTTSTTKVTTTRTLITRTTTTTSTIDESLQRIREEDLFKRNYLLRILNHKLKQLESAINSTKIHPLFGMKLINQLM